MKKLFAFALAGAMLVGCAAAAVADGVLEFVTEGSEKTNSFVETWAGEYKLVGYYVGEEFAEDNDVKTTGVVELESEATLNVVANMDGSATGSDAGVMVDQAAYYHAHVYDADATLTIGEDEYEVKCPWDGWTYEVPEEGACNYLSSIGKLSKAVKGEQFMELTGEDNEAFDENMKYIGMTTDGQLIICYADANLCKKGNDEEIGFALIFAPVVEGEAEAK